MHEGTLDEEALRVLGGGQQEIQNDNPKPEDGLKDALLLLEIGDIFGHTQDDWEAQWYYNRADKRIQVAGTYPTPDEFKAKVQEATRTDDEDDNAEAKKRVEAARQELIRQGNLQPTEDQVSRFGLQKHLRQPWEPLPENMQRVERITELLGGYQNLYFNLANIIRDTDPEKALEYIEQAIVWYKVSAGDAAMEQTAEASPAEQTTEVSLAAQTANAPFAPSPVNLVLLAAEMKRIDCLNRLLPAEASRSSLLQRAQQVLQTAYQMNDANIIVLALLRYAEVVRDTDRTDEAIRLLDEALRVSREMKGERPYDREALALKMLAEIYARRENWPAVVAVCRTGIALSESYRKNISAPALFSASMKSRIKLYTLGVMGAAFTGDTRQMLEWMERSKCRFALRYGQPMNATSSEFEALRKNFRRISAQLDAMKYLETDFMDSADSSNAPQDHKQPNKEDSREDNKEDTREELLRQRRLIATLLDIHRHKNADATEELPFDLLAVQASLEEEEAVLYYYFANRQCLFMGIIDRHQASWTWQDLMPSQRALLDEYAGMILNFEKEKPTPEAVEIDLTKLASFLLPSQPEARAFLNSKKRLIISPHQLLHTVPFQAMHWENQYLIERFALSYVPNLSSLLIRHKESIASEVLAVGINEYPGEAGLRVTYNVPTVEALEALYREKEIPTTVLTDKEATEEALEALAQQEALSKFRCLQLCTHGINVDSNKPMETYLKLYGSNLDGMEIARWNLNADLVVLMACFSGQRSVYERTLEEKDNVENSFRRLPHKELSGDEMFGLQAAFFAAGAKRVLGTLWPAHNPEASQITLAFHRHFAAGLLPEYALQAAIKEHLHTATRSRRKPLYWASFFLTVLGKPALASRGE